MLSVLATKMSLNPSVAMGDLDAVYLVSGGGMEDGCPRKLRTAQLSCLGEERAPPPLENTDICLEQMI